MSRIDSRDAREAVKGHGKSVQSTAKTDGTEPKVYRNDDDPDDYANIVELYEAEQRARQSGYHIDEDENMDKFVHIIMRENRLVFDALAKL